MIILLWNWQVDGHRKTLVAKETRWTGKLFTASRKLAEGGKKKHAFSPLVLWGGSKQNIPSDVIQNFPDAKPIGLLESSKPLRLSQSTLKTQSPLLWRMQGQRGLPAGSHSGDLVLLVFPLFLFVWNWASHFFLWSWFLNLSKEDFGLGMFN